MGEERRAITLEYGGRKLFGLYHTPTGLDRYPVLLLVHQFGGNKLGPSRLYLEMANRLSSRGMALLRFDLSGCGDSEGAFEEATVEGHLEEVLFAIAWLISQEEVEGRRVGLIGHSYGGALAALATQQCEIKSLALWAPVSSGRLWQEDWVARYPKEVTEGAIRCGAQIAGSEFSRPFLDIEAPQAVGEKESPPLLHVQGGRDGMVFPHHADRYREARKRCSNPSEFLCLPGGDHRFSGREEREMVIEATSLWFQKTL